MHSGTAASDVRNGPAPSAPPGLPLILLASKSPRRQRLLQDWGAQFRVVDTQLDDSDLDPAGAEPRAWAMSLAYLKAFAAARNYRAPALADHKQGADLRDTGEHPVILGADTVCVLDGRIVGQPRTADEARDMITQLRGRRHQVMTGVAIVCPFTMRRDIFCDAACVDLGDLTDAAIRDYAASGEWRGKAGGYNLEDRLNAGWNIRFLGEASTIMGLPLTALAKHLLAFCAADSTTRRTA